MKKGICFVERPDSIRVNSQESIIVAKQFEEIVRASPSEFTPFDKCSGKGFWRILLYRESKVTKQVLVCVVVSKSTQMNPVPELSEDLKNQIMAKFSSGTELPNGKKIVSLSYIVADDLGGGYKEGDQWEILSG